MSLFRTSLYFLAAPHPFTAHVAGVGGPGISFFFEDGMSTIVGTENVISIPFSVSVLDLTLGGRREVEIQRYMTGLTSS
jgi:hypothetical protein